jgi:hypothetical protein
MTKSEPSQRAIKELRDALRLAEEGKITDILIVGIGAEVSHHGFSIEKGPHRLVSLLGEVGVCVAGLNARLIADRMRQTDAAAAGLVGGQRPRFQS